AEGIQDEIVTRLSKISDLKVISRTSTQHYEARRETCPRSRGNWGLRSVQRCCGHVTKDSSLSLHRVRDCITLDGSLWKLPPSRRTISSPIQSRSPNGERHLLAAFPRKRLTRIGRTNNTRPSAIAARSIMNWF